MDGLEKFQNLSSEPPDKIDPPPTQTHTEQVNAVFTGSGNSCDPPRNHKALSSRIERDKPFKTSKRDCHVVKTNEYPFVIISLNV